MIVVMSSGYAFKDGEKPVFYPGNFESELIHNIIPYIENNFRVRKGRDYRAMAGLSLGSAQTTDIVAKNMRWNGSATARKHWMSYLCPVDAMRIRSERE